MERDQAAQTAAVSAASGSPVIGSRPACKSGHWLLPCERAGDRARLLRLSVTGDSPALPLIAPAISRAKDGLVLSKPRKRPAQTNRRSKVVPVIVVNLLVRVRRILADKLYTASRTPQEMPHKPGTPPTGAPA